ncbi:MULTISPECIES: hypothetical protein [Oryzomonas]|uniref:Uncharacterized protein n=2 Tax=Oryzomonas TaxID=2855184 RepID=A0A5A9XC14_9BACT|nr:MULTISPECIES: hypothetical protein [Oryzomonas]KAA0889799.1 hypothetical protein ET418_13580 [Oryzomonas rubra]KAB0671694.1 hypothetical protein F6V30_03705 [Oryzomonas sagensis]
MEIGYQYLALVVAGLAAVIWGLPAAHRLQKPYDIAAALAVLAGVILTAVGILLTIIPSFFR